MTFAAAFSKSYVLRCVLVILLGIVTVVALGCAQKQRLTDTSGTWPMFQFRADHNAVLKSSATSFRWTTIIGSKINASLALVNNVLFLDTIDKRVIALEARSGKVIWSTSVDNSVMSTPVVADGRVFVGTGHNGVLDGDGSKIYADNDPTRPWGREQGDAIIALRSYDGKRLWTFETIGEDMPSAIIVGDELIFGNGDMHAYALHLSSGIQLWNSPIPGVVTMASANYKDGVAFISSCKSGPYVCDTSALSTRTGQKIWARPFGDEDAAPTLGASRVYVAGFTGLGCTANRKVSTAVALRERDGGFIWGARFSRCGYFSHQESNERSISGLYFDHYYVQASGISTEVRCFSAGSGSIQWSFNAERPVKMTPVMSDGSVFFGDVGGYFYKLDARSGTLVARRKFQHPFTTSSPLINGNTLFLAFDGGVIAVSPMSLR